MNTDEQFLLTIIGITASVALGLLSLLIALAGVAGLLLLTRFVISVIATARRRRQIERARAARRPADLEAVAEAIAQEAGHNWTAKMMPEYRADFRRQARAAIAAVDAKRGAE